MTDYEFKIIEAMARYGGSFVKALAECFHKADSKNFYKLKQTFREYWQEYERMVMWESKNDKR